jgi:hypothetical protein
MSLIAIVAIVLGVLIVVFFIGGFVAANRNADAHEGSLRLRIAAADRALEEARAADRGWDRVLLEEAARAAIELARPGFPYTHLHLILVEDKPGIHEDRARMAAVGPEGDLHLTLVRHGDEAWKAESVG